MATVDQKMIHTYGDNGRMARLDKLTSLCPLPVLTAYWTPPPAWPRRIFDTRFSAITMNRAFWLITSTILLLYFLIMDIFLFTRYRSVNLVNEAKIGDRSEVYSPFTHLTVKAIISDHLRHYFFTPTAEYFNTVTSFATVFSFISPNMVSIFHLVCAFISGKFIASENLNDRRIGVVLYFFRTWLDSLDGIVYRTQAGRHLQYNSVYSSFGYFVDAFFDTLGGIFLSVGVLFYLFKRFGSDASANLPVWMKISDSSAVAHPLTNGHAVGSKRETYSYRYLFLKVLSYGIALAVAGICWDRAVKGFSEVFQVQIDDPSLSVLQFETSHSYFTLLLFFIWRFISGQTVLNYLLIAIYMDKIWEFLKCTQWVLLLITLPLYTVTVIYLQNIHNKLRV
ncbi:unnamed protein product [Candidula unifasciata]|uniref:Uncharacterized protein n=1 Tax=Candidula unifasciata TaxID=100452 RepID=A0A8S3ZKY3_9EUPU|nr:unnamed protein product [Candidula unifasciata]